MPEVLNVSLAWFGAATVPEALTVARILVRWPVKHPGVDQVPGNGQQHDDNGRQEQPVAPKPLPEAVDLAAKARRNVGHLRFSSPGASVWSRPPPGGRGRGARWR